MDDSLQNLDDLRQKVIADYRNKAELRFTEYETSGTAHCEAFRSSLKSPPAEILDIGSGSGRDAAYYADQGYQVTAVEPARELRELAQRKHDHANIMWMDDTLPDLKIVHENGMQFDHIHMNAVIFHFPKEYIRTILETAHRLLEAEGTLFVSLRYGPIDPDRPMFPITKADLLQDAKGLFELIDEMHKPDGRNRPGITWDRLLFRKET